MPYNSRTNKGTPMTEIPEPIALEDKEPKEK
jgi:hypothetical protein